MLTRLVPLLPLLLLAACSSADRLKQVGQVPTLSAIEDPTAQPGYRPVSMPMPAPEMPVYQANSLWRAGARGFFKDQRAIKVGDIVTVKVSITDQAKIDNSTKRTRSGSDQMGVESALGLESLVSSVVADPSNAVSTSSSTNSNGTGSVSRSERLTTTVAAVVTQALPNGNLVIEGKQEVRVNYEVREMIVAGVVRPEDIEADNTIESAKIAQARISYGGRGQISDVQQPRLGQQVLDILLPF